MSELSVTSPVDLRLHGDVLVIAVDNPPMNELGAAVRQGLLAAIRKAAADERVKAVVIFGRGETFFAGADIAEFGNLPVMPSLSEVVAAIEACPKPVVAAIHGTALGGGLEVALAAHYRVAAPSAKFGLPEVKLGILPGAGGAQRLTRVIGVEPALPIIVFGEPISAQKAEALGLIDRLVSEVGLAAEAVAFAQEAAARGERPVSSARTDKIAASEPGVFVRFRQQNLRRLKGLEAPEACIQAVQAAATVPFDQGLKLERELFTRLIGGPQSKALRHVFFAERAAATVDGLSPGTPRLPIETVGVVGAGTMGGGIAMTFLSAGIPVTLVEREQAALDRGVGVIRKTYEASVKKGRITAGQAAAAMGRLSPSLAYDDLVSCDLVVEAVFETLALKTEVMQRLDRLMKPGAILASNTSYLDLNALAAATGRPEHVIGLHFFSPANVMQLVEIVRGAKTTPEVVATCMALARQIGKVGVLAGVCTGFIGNRMMAVRRREADRLILQGAPYDRVDQVLVDFGFPMGPFQISDLSGLDLGWSRETSKGETIREVLCEQDRRGQKVGQGFYDYDETRKPTPSEEVRALIAEFADRRGEPQREIGGDEILERLLYPMINEGAQLLGEAIAQRASDIDVVWLNGFGWPTFTGGPMFWAGEIGLGKIVDALERHRPNLEPGLTLSPTLLTHAASGRFD